MRSMTGFGRGEARVETLTWVVECSSVNRKQLEVAIHMPRELAELESQVRSRVGSLCSRGRVSVTIRSEAAAGSSNSQLAAFDAAAVSHYLNSWRRLTQEVNLSCELRAADLLRLPGVLTGEALMTQDTAAIWQQLEPALEAALKTFQQMRQLEGEHLRQDVSARLQTLEKLLAEISALAPQVLVHQRQTLRQRLELAGLPVPLDDERVLKEIALYADRCDLSEELTRAASHAQKFRELCASDEPVGRSLDFLVQEFFRELNTMGSKGNHAGIAHAVVAAKTELEKIREQLQNIE
jgi:uncharacterized protein (TIGR00255 family)